MTRIYLFLNINQLGCTKFYNKFISSLYMFRAPCAHHQEGKKLYYTVSGIITVKQVNGLKLLK